MALLVGLVLAMGRCNKPAELEWLNHADSAEYVGIATCSGCHPQHAEGFAHTGMGMSFRTAVPKHSAIPGKAHMTDPHAQWNYLAHFKRDSLFVLEYRLLGSDTVHQLERYVPWIIGSGHHTNSHIWSDKGFLFQAPFTYYTQSNRADLPPGFEGGANSRFGRAIGLECMSCHNAQPQGFVMGSENKFDQVPLGIDCERCHGPGSLHVAKIQRGEITDTAVEADRTIVNPARLSPTLRMEICQRCHLQGNAVLADGKGFLDFKPGMELRSVMDVYLPRYEGAEDQFIMASHADRLKLSKCFQVSKTLDCTTCHNPHQSVRTLGSGHFNLQCQTCHTPNQENECTTPSHERLQKGDNCVGCHMPVSGSIDIPHVTVHDHRIAVPKPRTASKQGAFVGLQSINNANPSAKSRVLAYLQQFEQFGGEAYLLDSALVLLNQMGDKEQPELWVRYFFLKQQFSALVDFLKSKKTKDWLALWSTRETANRHAWTCYRVAEAYLQTNAPELGMAYIQQAIALAPLVAKFHQKQAALYIKLQQPAAAMKVYSVLERDFPESAETYASLGYLWMASGQLKRSAEYLNKAYALDPDDPKVWMNKAAWAMASGDPKNAEIWLVKVLKADPANAKALQALKMIQSP
jgi:hypothetical protein